MPRCAPRSWRTNVQTDARAGEAASQASPSLSRRRKWPVLPSYDIILAEWVIRFFTTQVIRRRGPERSLETVEFATLDWVDWFNTQRLLEPIRYLPPAEYEARYDQQAAVA